MLYGMTIRRSTEDASATHIGSLTARLLLTPRKMAASHGCNADAAIAPGIGSGGNAALYATAGNTAGVGGGSGAEDGQGKERAGAVPNPTYGGAAALYLDTDIEQQPIYSEALTPDDSARYDTVYVESVATAGPDEQPLYSEPAVNAETDGCYSGANTAV